MLVLQPVDAVGDIALCGQRIALGQQGAPAAGRCLDDAALRLGPADVLVPAARRYLPDSRALLLPLLQ